MRRNFLRRPQGAAEYAADALRLVGLMSVFAGGIGWSITDAGVLAFALPALLVPRFVGARPAFDLAFGLTVLVAAWSNVLELYTAWALWDLVVHFVATGVIAAMVYLLLAQVAVVPVPGTAGFSSRVALVIVPVIGLALSALWEMIEWLGYTFISSEIFVAYDDTIGDMAVGGLGALLTGVVVAQVRLTRADAFAQPRLEGRATGGRARR